MTYGITYIGSKNTLAERICDLLPAADCLCDIFFGGGAVTHCALTKRKWNTVIANDVLGTPKMVQDAAAGAYDDRLLHFVSREKFFATKNIDLYNRFMWSFNADGATYVFGRHKEAAQKAYFNAAVLDKWTDENVQYKHLVDGETSITRRNILLRKVLSNNAHSLEPIARWMRLQRFAADVNINKVRLCVEQKDYRDVLIPKDCVVYADPPYRTMKGKFYSVTAEKKRLLFDYEAFYNWARDLPNVCIISEYAMPSDFVEIAATKKVMLGSTDNAAKATEKLFVHKSKYQEWQWLKR